VTALRLSLVRRPARSGHCEERDPSPVIARPMKSAEAIYPTIMPSSRLLRLRLAMTLRVGLPLLRGVYPERSRRALGFGLFDRSQ
jgi:hypothetical protein